MFCIYLIRRVAHNYFLSLWCRVSCNFFYYICKCKQNTSHTYRGLLSSDRLDLPFPLTLIFSCAQSGSTSTMTGFATLNTDANAAAAALLPKQVRNRIRVFFVV